MRVALVFCSIFFLSCLVGSSHQVPVKDLIQLVVMYIELAIQHIGTLNLIENKTFPLDVNNPDLIEGNFGIEKMSVTGLEALEVHRNNIDYDKTDTHFSFCANLSIPDSIRLEFVGYDADVGLFNAVPLYGKGKLLLGIKDIDFAICSDLDLTTVQLTDFLLMPAFSGLEFEFTGFWNNPELSEFLTKIVSTLEGIVMAFWRNEIKCISCILSISLEGMINDLLNPPTTTTDFYEFAEVVKTNCVGDCVLSDYPSMKKMFDTNTSELLITVLKDNNFKNFVFGLEEYLNKHLEEKL